MRCEICPHLREIKTALTPCAVCESGKLHGEVHIDASPDSMLVLSHALPSEHSSQTGVTALSPEVEDSLRIVLATIFSKFDPVEMLLLRHIMSGETFATFFAPLRELRDRLGGYTIEDSSGFRSLVGTWADRMRRNFPPIAELFKAAISANSHTHKRIAHPPRKAGRR